jgi:anti-anti-sigma regulatory factor
MERKAVLAFCGLTPTIDKTFRIMGLAQYAAIYPTEDEALRAVGAAAPTARPQVTGPQ